MIRGEIPSDWPMTPDGRVYPPQVIVFELGRVSVPKFRKKPIVIEARRIPVWDDPDRGKEHHEEMARLSIWCDGRQTVGGGILIKTLEGTMLGKPGDWIICGVNGEFYPCDPDVFDKTYEPVEDE